MKTGTPSDSGKLDLYRSKRSAERTPEPFGPGPGRPRLFVVQEHSARRLHYDLRLEWSGTLWSWAVPKGPSPDPASRHLAVQVEDHPVEYADFEGIIPDGNYGAGAVIVWDRGLWAPHGDPVAGLREGKLHFDLYGYKLRGEWILIRTKGGGDREWILMKKRDQHSVKGGEYPQESIVSGLTVDELRDAPGRAAALSREISAAGAARRRVQAASIGLMLAQTAESGFSSKEWLFELKYDGYRVIAWRSEDGRSGLRSRNGVDLAPVFPEIARALRALPYGHFVMDAELTSVDEEGRPMFQRLQQRAQLSRARDIERSMMESPCTLFAFDLLGFEDCDLRPLPLRVRKTFLARICPRVGPVRYVDHIEEMGSALFEKTRELELEGIMAKKADAPYRSGRSALWLKIPHARTGDFVVCGYTEPKGSRVALGALHLGVYEGAELVYAGKVGTGLSEKALTDLFEDLRRLRTEASPCSRVLSSDKTTVWVRPERVVEVRYKQWTEDGSLRAPVFLRIREDKRPRECRREDRRDPANVVPDSVQVSVGTPASLSRRIDLTNTDKVYWPGDGITKGDLVEYYRAVAPWILPYLKDRPLVLTRYPDGIEGKSFYQKNAPGSAPAWIRRQRIYSGHAGKEIEYFICDDEESLLYLINTGTIPIHVWPSRAQSIQQPDWCILDLDPKGAPFAHVIRLARSINALCEEIGLPTYVKLTGSSGLHILIPLGGQCTFEQSRLLGHLIARIIESEHKDIATTARPLDDRKGRVYLDYLQNRHGQLIVAPYSVRPLPGAPVSAPLTWTEVGGRLEPRKYTIRNLGSRLRRRKSDPLLPVLSDRPNLLAALERLSRLTRLPSPEREDGRRAPARGKGLTAPGAPVGRADSRYSK